MKKTLEDLTPEVRAKIPEYLSWAKDDLYSGKERAEFNNKDASEYIDIIYGIAERDKPANIFADNPTEYKIMFELIETPGFMPLVEDIYRLKNSDDTFNEGLRKEQELQTKLKEACKGELSEEVKRGVKDRKNRSHWLWYISSYARGLFSWYYFIHKELNVPVSNPERLKMLKEKSKNGIVRAFFKEGYTLSLIAPEYIKRNDIGFHCTDSPAIKYPGTNLYYVNGRSVNEHLFKSVSEGTLTSEEFRNMENEEDRAAVVTILKDKDGDIGLMKFLGAELVDEQTVKHSDNYSEVLRIYRTKESFPEAMDLNEETNKPYAWLNMKCPSTGQEYMIPTCPSFNDAVECAKWHRPPNVPVELTYSWMSAN